MFIHIFSHLPLNATRRTKHNGNSQHFAYIFSAVLQCRPLRMPSVEWTCRADARKKLALSSWKQHQWGHIVCVDKRTRNCASQSVIRGEEIVSLLPLKLLSPEKEEWIRLASLTDKKESSFYTHISNFRSHSTLRHAPVVEWLEMLQLSSLIRLDTILATKFSSRERTMEAA